MSANVFTVLFSMSIGRGLMRRLSLALMAWLSLTAAHASAAQATVLFSIKPLAMLYQAMATEDMVKAAVLIDNSKNTHDYQLSVDDIQRLQQTTVFYWLGGEANLQKLSGKLQDKRWHKLDNVPSHAWLEQKSLDALIAQLSQLMQQQNPTHAQHIQQRQQSLQRQVQQRFSYWQQQFQPYSATAILLGHTAFAGFAANLGLQHVEIYRGGHSHGHKASGMHDLIGLQKEIAEGHIRCAFAEPDISFTKLQGRFAQLQVAMLYPMAQKSQLTSKAYIDYLDSSAASIYQCLRGDH